ncbi:CcdC family protein [Oceanobacillus manasiensis]|uniref:CcdC family protein n=1 Tax=Oceanobacillus manasiensis TaxID=586413 RepID=UPI0005AA6041|nr:cytochrome c biogenesis protein CcdC [Oceanobacillus manasiensis]
MFWLVASTLIAACMAVAMIFIRIRGAKKPASVKKIMLPPLFMSTGALMFIFPVFQISLSQFLEALIVGMVCSIFLVKASRFEIRDEAIFLIPSKSFIFILFGLLVFRIVMKLIIGGSISAGETSGMFFILAFGMIFTWRCCMLFKFLQLEKQLHVNA